MNVALYGPRRNRWAMTERGRGSLFQTKARLEIGPSSLIWDGDGLLVCFDEVTAPAPSRVKGRLRLRPKGLAETAFTLDQRGGHSWRPIAPRADVELRLENPDLTWRGDGYFDSNFGDEPLEDAFRFWTWSRGHAGYDALLFYDVETRDGGAASVAISMGPKGAMTVLEPPPFTDLGSTFWRMPRPVRADSSAPPHRVRTLEDAPFYTRSAFEASLDGRPARIVHESLDLDRLRSPVVRAMLPFRMPRRFW
jgi:carotenoid 1,2-hydratase